MPAKGEERGGRKEDYRAVAVLAHQLAARVDLAGLLLRPLFAIAKGNLYSLRV